MTRLSGPSLSVAGSRIVMAALYILGLGIIGLGCIEASPRWIFVGSDRRAYISSDSDSVATMFPINVDDTTIIGFESRIFTVVRDSERRLSVSCLFTLNIKETSRRIVIHGQRAKLTIGDTRLAFDPDLSSKPGRELTGRADGILFDYVVPSDLTFLPFPVSSAEQPTIGVTLDSVIWVDNIPLSVPKLTMYVKPMSEVNN